MIKNSIVSQLGLKDVNLYDLDSLIAACKAISKHFNKKYNTEVFGMKYTGEYKKGDYFIVSPFKNIKKVEKKDGRVEITLNYLTEKVDFRDTEQVVYQNPDSPKIYESCNCIVIDVSNVAF